MNRKLKALGLALFAAFAMSAVAASAASATNHKFDVHEASSAVLTAHAHSDQVFTVGPNNVPLTCKKVTIEEATVLDGATSVTTAPTYSECSTPLGAATVDFNGCHYKFTAETDANNHAQVHIECGAKPIEITAGLGCIVKVNSQTVQGIRYDNVDNAGTDKDEVTLTSTVTNDIAYTAEPICGLAGIPTSGEDGDYVGSVTVQGYEDNAQGKENPNVRRGISVVNH